MLTRRGFLKGVASVGAGLTAFGAYAIGIEPLLRLNIARYAITPPRWPSDLKLRIVALADIHACDPWMSLSRIRSLVEQAQALEGDIILLLGDYVAGSRLVKKYGESSEWAPLLGELRAPLGVHAVQGNHDWWEDKGVMRAGGGQTFVHKALLTAGINVLENDAVRLVHQSRAFWLAGLGDQIAFTPVRRSVPRIGVDDLRGTMAKITDDAPAILMAHEPDIFPRVPERFALTLSGHTHGGQVNLFGWRPVAASHLSDVYYRGHFRERDRDLVVSSGLGCSIAPIRVGVPPEILVVELGG